MFEPLIDNYFSGPGVALLLALAGIVFWVMVVVSFFSMAINISKMRRELHELHEVVRNQTELMDEQRRAASGPPPDSYGTVVPREAD